MSAAEMSPALQAHLREIVRKTQEPLMKELRAEAIKQLSGKTYVDETARQLAISKRMTAMGPYRALYAQAGQLGTLTSDDINVLKVQFEDLVSDTTKSSIRKEERIKKVVQENVGAKRKLDQINSIDKQKLAASLLGLGGRNVVAYGSLINGLIDVIDKSTAATLPKTFIEYLNSLNAEAVAIFNTPNLAENFMAWYEEQFKTAPKSTTSKTRRTQKIKEQEVSSYAKQATSSGLGSIFSMGASMASEIPEDEKPYDITIPESEHALLNLRFKEYVTIKLNKNRKVAEYISLNTDAGHVMGLFNIKLIRALDIKTAEFEADGVTYGSEISIDTSGTIPQVTVKLNPKARGVEDDKAIKDLERFSIVLTAIFQQLSNIDFLTSSYVFAETGVDAYIKAVKDNFSRLGGQNIKTAFATYSMQIEWLNREAGRQLSVAGATLGNLIRTLLDTGSTNKDVDKSLKRFARSFKGLSNYSKKVQDVIAESKLQKTVDRMMLKELNKNIRANARILVTVAGSDTMKDSLAKAVGSIFTGTSYTPKPTVIPNKKVNLLGKKSPAKPKIKVSKPNVSAAALKTEQQLQKVIASTKKVVIKLKQEAITRKIGVSLVSLQTIINGGLFEQIKKNMGTGDRRDVLNFRTGRLAESAKIERMSESREGMITAFYSYMKNPYATFSRGGLQQRPFTRDPKTLISKSIRELAQPLVANRMRAVLV